MSAPIEPEQWNWVYDLYRLGQAVEANADARETLERLLRHIVTGFRGRCGCLALHSPDNEGLTIVAGIDLPPNVIGTRISLGDGILGWVARHGAPLLLNGDYSNDPRFRNLPRRAHARPQSAMCWPLRLEGRVIGALSINRGYDEPAFSETDLMQADVLIKLVTVVVENARLHAEHQERIRQLLRMNEQVEESHRQLLQSEKMACIGQLAAGVAHEINNPVGYVYANLGSLRRYADDLLGLLEQYRELEASGAIDPAAARHIAARRNAIDLEYLREDLPNLLEETREGVTRVKQIVRDLKEFSHVDDDVWQFADLREGIDRTLNIVHNELKYKADVVKQYAELPPVRCLASQLNQVFMNLLVNAAQAIDGRGEIYVRTGAEGEQVWVEVSDTGCGINPEHLNRVFDPFFTTKPVGKGTGLGLALAYRIIERHHGRIEVHSEPGVGTTFRVWLPVRQGEEVEAAQVRAGGR